MEKGIISETTYCQFQYWMTKRLGLKGTELMIYGLIHGFSQDGTSFCYAPLSYMMEMTGLSKSAVMNILKKLVEKKLIIKQTVKQYVKQTKHGIRVIKASGAQFFCIYYTAESRKNTPPLIEDNVFSEPEELDDELDYSDFENEKTEKEAIISENPESRFDTRESKINESRVSFQYPVGSRFDTRSGVVSIPNNNDNNIYITSSSKTKEKLQEINPSFTFSKKIISDADDFLLHHNLDYHYFEWVYSLLAKRENIRNVSGYFLNMIFQEINVEKYKLLIKQEKEVQEKRQKQFTCPVCGFKNSETEFKCRQCHFDLTFQNDEKEVAEYKKLYKTLPVEDISRFLSKKRKIIANAFKTKKVENISNELEKLYGDYGIRSSHG